MANTIDSHSDWVRAAAWNADGSLLASASRDKTIKVFDKTFDQPIATYAGHKQDVQTVAFFKSDQLLTFDVRGHAHKWKQGETKKHDEFPAADNSPFRVLAHKDGVWLGSGSVLSEFDWNGNKVREIELPARYIFSMALGAEQTRIAAGDAKGRVTVWELEGRTMMNDFLAIP